MTEALERTSELTEAERLEEIYNMVMDSQEIKIHKKICSLVFDEFISMLNEEQIRILLKYEEEKEDICEAIKNGIMTHLKQIIS